MTEVITELEVRYTANTADVEAAAKKVQGDAEKIEKKPVKQTVTGDATDALAAMGRVEAEAKKIVSAKTMAMVDANITKAETSLEKVSERLEYLRSVEATMEVTADIKRAESAIQQITRRRDALVSAKETMTIDADVSPAESALGDVEDAAGEAGERGGDDAGAGLADGIVAALATIPVAGAVIGIGVAAGKALAKAVEDGMGVEVRQDRLQALTGMSEQDAARFGRIASEAYTQGFGESIESNMDSARIAIQGGLIDPSATRADSQKIIESLAGIGDVLGEEVGPISTAVTTMLRSGLVKTADEAFDLLAAGAREGVNAQEDLLDTFTEYPALFSRLGLDGPTALGLINQGLEGGARNADLAADALKEFQIRATDGAESSAEGFRMLGFDAEDMTAKIAAGGDGAREGLDQVLDKLRETEDPVLRNAAAVALFGTQAEDLGDALFSMDPSTAVDALGQVTGAAQTMFDTLASNDASSIENAKRNIEVAADGIKGALAGAFSEPLGNFADWVSQNRGPIMEFIGGLVNGALDVGAGFINFTADSTEAIGEFVAGPIADLVAGLATILDGMSWAGIGVPGAQQAATDLTEMAEGMRGFKDTTAETADSIRDRFLPGIEDARSRFNEFNDAQIDEGYLHDSMMRVASAVEQVGFAADGATPLVDALTTAQDGTVQASSALEQQLLGSAVALADELAAAQATGEGQDELSARYNATRDALAQQLETMGLTTDQAYALVDAVLQTPEKAETAYASNSDDEKAKVQALADRITTLPDGTVVVSADTSAAQTGLDSFVTKNNGKTIKVYVDTTNGNNTYRIAGTGLSYQHDGSVLMPMAHGGTLTPMAPIAQHVDPNTFRVVGDRMDVPESYIPHDGSARSRAILLETMRAFGVVGMADGATLAPAGFGGQPMTAQVSGSFVRDLGNYLDALWTSTGRAAFGAARDFTSDALAAEARGRL